MCWCRESNRTIFVTTRAKNETLFEKPPTNEKPLLAGANVTPTVPHVVRAYLQKQLVFVSKSNALVTSGWTQRTKISDLFCSWSRDSSTSFEMEVHQAEEPPSYVLRTSDRKLVEIGKNLWSMSPVLMTHSPGGEMYRVQNTEATVKALVDVYENKQINLDDIERINMLSLLYHLQLYYSPFLKLLVATSRPRRPFENPLNPQCLPHHVLGAFAAICDLPLRKWKYYVRMFSMLEDFYCSSDMIDNFQLYMRTVHKIYEKRSKKRTDLGLGKLPIGFGKTNAAMTIIDVNNQRRTFVLRSKKWVRVELFGNHFNVNQVDIKEFYLNYGRFVIFSDHNCSVYFKNLKDSSEPLLLLDDCEQLLTKHDKVFVLTLEDLRGEGRSILKWDGSHFKVLFSDIGLGQRIDFSTEENLLGCIDASRQRIVILSYRNDSLSLMLSVDVCSRIAHFCFFSTGLYVWGENNARSKLDLKLFKTRKSEITGVDRYTENICVLGGKLMKYALGHWYIYKTKSFRPIFSPGQFCAAFDLKLLP